MHHPIRVATNRTRPRGSTSAYQAGATMVEFAIVSPFAIVLVLAIIQLGFMLAAKQVVNQAAFLAARAGAVQNAQMDPMKQTAIRALLPFYQDSTNTDDFGRLLGAFGSAQIDLLPPSPIGFLDITMLNPTSQAFDDFGITSNAMPGHTYIPNDNLEYRPHDIKGNSSGMSIQDANALKIRLTYGYQLKVPLMQSVIKSVMCGFDTGITAFGRGGGGFIASPQDCLQYYDRGRVPIVSYATVQMQSPAWQN